MMMKQGIALTVALALASGCATAGPSFSVQQPIQSAAPPSAPPSGFLAEYVQKLQPGIKVRVDRVSGGTIKGTLMKATSTTVVVQRRTRVPEPPVEIPLDHVLAVTPESSNGSNIGKAIGIGAAAGAAAALGVILILIAAFD
jgi:hypothetical protein